MFSNSLTFSYNDSFLSVAPHYLARLFHTNPAMVIPHCGDALDRAGGDFEVQTAAGPLFVDYKLRNRRFSNDICIELVSACRQGGLQMVEGIGAAMRASPGWTVDRYKRSDYVLFVWPDSDPNSFLAKTYDFRLLRLEAMARWQEWVREYGVHSIPNRRGSKQYFTYCSFIPCSSIRAPAFPEVILRLNKEAPE